MSNSNNSKFAVLKFAAIVCLICSLVVSFSAVSLRGLQDRNKLNEKRFNILVAAGLATSGEHLSTKQIDERYQKILPVVVNLKTGQLANGIDPNTYDMYAAAKNPKTSERLTNDPANIQRIAKDASAYLVLDGDKVKNVVLPVQGYGLWSTLYGFTALNLEQKPLSISGLTFYQQAETPGLGAEITNPTWQARWDGIQPYKDGLPDIKVAKNANHEHKNEVDSISGATLTSRGVEHLMNFWLGKQGFAAFIQNLQDGKITVAEIKKASQG